MAIARTLYLHMRSFRTGMPLWSGRAMVVDEGDTDLARAPYMDWDVVLFPPFCLSQLPDFPEPQKIGLVFPHISGAYVHLNQPPVWRKTCFTQGDCRYDVPADTAHDSYGAHGSAEGAV